MKGWIGFPATLLARLKARKDLVGCWLAFFVGFVEKRKTTFTLCEIDKS